jgi:hypothetical protein
MSEGISLGDITAGVGFIVNTASLTAALLRAEQLATERPVLIHVGLDPAQIQAQFAKIQSGLLGGAPIKIGLDTTTIQAALQGMDQTTKQAVGQMGMTWKQFVADRMSDYMRMEGSHAAAMKRMGEEWRAYKGSASEAAAAVQASDKAGMNSAANYRNTLTLNMGIERTRMNEYRSGIALNTRLAQEAARKETAAQQQAAQSYRATLQLNSRLATAAAQTEAQAEAEKARNYRATTALNLQLAGMRAAAERAGVVSAQSAAQQSATAFAAGAERTKQALDGIKLTYAQVRAQFDKDSGAAGNDWRAQRDAALAYQNGVNGVSTALTELRNKGEATTNQLKQMADVEARLSREQNTLEGGVNRLGISGNFSNALSGAQQLSGFMPGMIGQSLGAASAFQQIAASSGVMGVALGAAGLAVFALGKAFVTTSEAFGSFQQGLQGISSVDTSLSGKDMQDLADGFLKLSTELPITTEQLTNIARGAVQMGVTGKAGIMDFTQSIAMLGIATRDNNKSMGDTGQLAEELGKFLNETGSTAQSYTGDLKGVVATLAAVDKVTPGTIQSTLSLARYMASGSTILNINKNSLLGIAGALSGLGANAEAGGGAFIRVLASMNRAAGGSKEQLNGLVGVAGITQDELANIFQGQVTSRASTFAKIMGVTSDEFRNVVKTNPAQAFQLLADGLSKAHASGADMTAVLDELGLKNIRDIRLIDQLTVGHQNLKVALDASSKSSQNQADLQDRVNKATQNSVDKTTELKNAWHAFFVSAGETSNPLMNHILDFLTRAAKGAKEFSDNMRGVSAELTQFQSNAGIDISTLSKKDADRVRLLVSNIQSLTEQGQNAGGLDANQQARYTAYARELEQIRASAVQAQGGGTFNGAGPLLPGQTRGGQADEAGLNILNASTTTTGNAQADDLIGWCARWVKLTLEKAQPGAKAQIDKWFGGDADTVKNRLSNAGKLQAYSGNVNDLSPGDVVVYDKNHIAIYLGNGMVRGNNTIGGKNGAPITDERIGSGGSIAGIVRAADAASGFTGTPATPSAGGNAGGSDDARLRATGQKIYDAYYIGGDHSTKVIDALRAFRKAHADVWQGIMADGADAKKKLKESGLTDAQWAQYKNRAMELAELQAKQQAGKLSQSASLTATQEIGSFNSNPVKAAALAFATGELARQKTLTAQNLQAEQRAAAESARISKALTAGKVADAQTALQHLKQIQSDELDDAGQSQAKRLQVVKQTSQQIFNAEEALARVTRKAALQTAADEKDPTLSAALVKKANSDYTLSVETARTERVKALNAAEKAQTAEHDQRVKTATASQLAAEQALADGKSALAKTSAQRVITAYDTEVAKAGSSAQLKLNVEQDYGKQRLAAMNALAAAEAQIAIQKLKHDTNNQADNPGVTPAQKVALYKLEGQQITAINADMTAKQKANAATVANDLKTAGRTVTDSIHSQRDAYHNLAEQLRQSGPLDAAAAQKALEDFNALGRAAEKLGLTADPMVKQARIATFALIQQGHAAFDTSRDLVDITANNDAYVQTNLDLAKTLDTLGNRIEELDLLTTTVNEMQDAFQRGEVSADALNKAREARNALAADMSLEGQAQDFLAGLSGSIDEQVAAITAKLSDPNTTVDLRQKIMDMTQGFGVDPVTPGPMGEAATQALQDQKFKDPSAVIDQLTGGKLQNPNDPNSFKFNADGAQLEGFVKDTTDYLSSEVGKMLDPAIRKRLQDALDQAAAYVKATATLDAVKANPEGYGDTRDLAKKPIPFDPVAAAAALANQDSVSGSQGTMDSTRLEAQHSQGLISEQAYLDQKRKLDEVAALNAFLVADRDQSKHAANLAAYQAQMLGIDQKYNTDKKVIDDKATTDALAAQKTNETFLIASRGREIALARTHLDNLHTAQLVSDRAFQSLRESQDADAAKASYDAGTTGWFQYQEELTRITRQGVADRAALDKAGFDQFVQGIDSLASALGGLQTVAGTALTAIGGALKLGAQFKDLQKQNATAFGSGGTFFDKLGAIGGDLGMVGSAISLVGQLGDAILNLSPAYQAAKKAALDLAAAETAAMGSKNFGGKSILNPYYDKLQADAAALTTKANAGFWQQLGWAIFGGAPKTLDKAASETLQLASQTFNDFASGLYGSLESALMNAFDSGNFDGVAASVEKSLNGLVAKMYLQTLIAKSNISRDIAALADDQAAGRSITGDLARLKGDTSTVISQFQQGSAALPGFGAGAATAGTGTSAAASYTVSGAGTAAQFGPPELKFPDSFMASLNGFSSAVPVFSAASQRLMDAANLIVSAYGASGMPNPRTGRMV